MDCLQLVRLHRTAIILIGSLTCHSFVKWLRGCLIVSHPMFLISDNSGLIFVALVHSNGVVHGDLTGVRTLYITIWDLHVHSPQSNILIDDEGKACLCDFGLSSIAAEFQGTSYLTSTIGGNVRWAAPELYRINEDDSIPTVTTQSDIYSFGSVVLEVRLYA